MVTERPDGFSAALSARLQGSRVEDVSLRTESTSTFVNPDGTLTLEDYGGPVRVVRDDEWVDVDYSLQSWSDGSLRPAASPVQVSISGGGTSEAGRVTFEDGTSLAVTWPGGALPEPTVDGATARYAVSASTTLVVSAAAVGLDAWIELGEEPATDEPTYALGLVGDGVHVTQDDGGLVLRDVDGEQVGRTANLVAWDAQVDHAGDPENVVDLDSSLRKVSTTGQVTRSELTLEAPNGFLADPDTQYPVVIDPNISAVLRLRDTWVASGVSTLQGTDYRLLIGASAITGGTEARSFLKWSSTAYEGKEILSATMRLYQYDAGGCTARPTSVRPLAGEFLEGSTTWANKPAMTAAYGTTTVTFNYGGNDCTTDNGWASFDVTNFVKKWADGTLANNGLGVFVPTDYATNTWYEKRFCSFDPSSLTTVACSTAFTDHRPVLSVTYNSAPAAPSAPSFTSTGDAGYTNVSQPVVSSSAADGEGQKVALAFEAHSSKTTSSSTLKASCTAAAVASGAKATCTLGTALTSATYYLRAKATDASGAVSGWSSWTTIAVDRSVPGTPTISASGFTAGAWLDSTPTGNVFTFTTSTSDVVRFAYSKDGGAWTKVAASGTTPTATLAWSPKGSHTLALQAIDRAGNISATRTFQFGSGPVTISAPTAAGIRSTANVEIKASGPAPSVGTVNAKVMVRPGRGVENEALGDLGSPAGEWTAIDDALTPTVSGSTATLSTSLDLASAADQFGRARKLTHFDVQVCFMYTTPSVTRCTWVDDTTSHVTATYLPHAFGDNFPVSDAGPGQVALWTGEFQMTVTDLSVPGYSGDLSISRSYSTFDNDAARAGVLGKGWRASIDGVGAGAAALTVLDDTTFDGTISLIDEEGNALTYAQEGTSRVARQSGVYIPVDDETAQVGGRLVVATGGTSMTFTDPTGTITTWEYATGQWRAVSVQEPGDPGVTSFTYDPTGRVTRITAPIPPAGDGPAITCAPGAEMPGCRVLVLNYGTSSSGGDYAGQLKNVAYVAYDPDKAGGPGMTSTEVAAYTYDTSGLLTAVTDPRTSLSTHYSYSGTSAAAVPLIASLTPPGLAAFTFTFSSPTNEFATSLQKVGRGPANSGGTSAVLAAFRYGIDPSAAGMPLLAAGDVALWGQTDTPTKAFAVFGQDHAAEVPTTPTSTDLPYGDLQLTDDDGRVVNTATYSSQGWALTSTGYADTGLVVRELDARAIATIIDAGGVADPDQYATIIRYNPEITAPFAITTDVGDVDPGDVLTVAGTVVTDVWGPTVEVTSSDGSVTLARKHTHADYDQGAPNDGVNPQTGLPYLLPTTLTIRQADPASGSSNPEDAYALGTVVATTVHGYAPVEDGASLTGPTSGWVLSTPTTSHVDADGDGFGGADDIVSRTILDAEGRTIASRQPNSDGTDAGTTTTSYYTAGSQLGADAVCGAKPQWAGLACRTSTADAAATPVTTIASYDKYLSAQTVTEARGTVTRTTTSTFDTAGRSVTTTVAVTGLTSSTPVPTTKTVYSSLTGLVVATQSLTGPGDVTDQVTTGYDGWGRPVTYTDTDGTITSTTYDAAGRVASSAIAGVGTTTNTYAPVTGLLVEQSATGVEGSFTATYDMTGQILTQQTPGGVLQRNTYNIAGRQTSRTYEVAGSPVATWTQGYDILDRVNGIDLTAPSLSRTQRYTFDNAARLVSATDTANGSCTRRDYGFDPNGNRVRVAASIDDGACTMTGGTTSAWAFDAADRVQLGANGVGAYVYDELGRQTTVPAVDTPAGATVGDLTIAYYDTDAARGLTQDGTTTTYQLDPRGRRTTASSTTGAMSSTTTHHYSDTSDNPTWATTASGPETATTRYLSSIAGDLSATLADDSLSIALTDPHGDVLTTLTRVDDNLVPDVANLYDEYGNATTHPNTGALTYGWLGAEQRAADTSGLLLMGARLYSPRTGSFTSVDPITSGNTTAYAYPQDPVNEFDLDGLARTCNFLCVGAAFAVSLATNAGCKVALASVVGLGAFFCSGVAQGMNYLAKYVWKYAGDKAFSALAAAGEFFKGFVFGLVKFTVLRKLGQYLLRWASGTKYYTVVTYVNKWLLKGPKHAR